MVEADAFGSEPVQVGGDDDVVAGAAEDVGAVLVGVDEQQVGAPVAHRRVAGDCAMASSQVRVISATRSSRSRTLVPMRFAYGLRKMR